jgi:hypothetical protein
VTDVDGCGGRGAAAKGVPPGAESAVLDAGPAAQAAGQAAELTEPRTSW